MQEKRLYVNPDLKIADLASVLKDVYKRQLYNHILGQHDPETGMVTYFLPLLSVLIFLRYQILPRRPVDFAYYEAVRNRKESGHLSLIHI